MVDSEEPEKVQVTEVEETAAQTQTQIEPSTVTTAATEADVPSAITEGETLEAEVGM